MKKIDSYDVLPIDKVIGILLERLSKSNFFVLVAGTEKRSPMFFSSYFKDELNERILALLENEQEEYIQVVIKELTTLESPVKNEYSSNKLNYQRVSIILLNKEYACLLRKDDIREALINEDCSDMLFYDAKYLLKL